jgi:competence protein ComEC
MVAFIAAVAAVQTLAMLPGAPARALLAVGSAFCFCGARWLARHKLFHLVVCCIGAASAGASYAIERGQARLDDALAARHESRVSRVTVQVASLPDHGADAIRFDADVLDAGFSGVPSRIRVAWPVPMRASDMSHWRVIPGQRWRMALVLKRPHAAQNPHAADGEARLFHRNIRATGTVRGTPRLLDDGGSRLGVAAVHRLRHVLRERMREVLGDARYGAVVIALALGDQAAVPREDWRVFNATGITHLVSISGLHVTLVAGVAGAAVSRLWRRLRWRGTSLAELWPAQLAGIVAALCVAFCYCLLAGWGIPARRTFFTLTAAGTAALARMPLSTPNTLLLAATIVTILDPWAPIAPGFWLSFGAVAAVLAWGHGGHVPVATDANRAQRAGRALCHAGRLQLVVTLSLTPLLAFLTQQVAVAAPLANALAIPAVSLVVTPLALLCAALCAIPGALTPAGWAGGIAHWVFELVMHGVAWLADRDWAVRDVAAAPGALLALALAGIGWALLPPGMPSRRWAWLLVLPALCWRPSRPADGEWRLTALDVGQGGAVVVETATRTLVFDAGPLHRNGTDAAQQVIRPYLRARGVDRIDTLVLSHGDQDHAGGLDSLMRAVPVDTTYAPFDVVSRLRRDAALRGHAVMAPGPAASLRCESGQAWEADGVRFMFLHPRPAELKLPAASPGPATGSVLPVRKEQQARRKAASRATRPLSNAGGCVLLLTGRYHAALLPGDVGAAQERLFAQSLLPVDLVIAPHHGSATSSSDALVQTARAAHVVAQVGNANRFRHPAASVQRRWRRAGAIFWRTDRHGAVVAQSRADGLAVHGQRELARRYWHEGAPP